MELENKTITTKSKICCVYIIKNNITKKVYIGSTTNVYDRYHNHKSKLTNNVHENNELQIDFNSLGIKCFSFLILNICDEKELQDKEQSCLDGYNLKYNLQPTAYSNLNRKQSDSTKIKVSKANSGCRNGQAKLNEEQVKAIRKSTSKGIILSKKYNISCAQVSMVKNYKSYTNIL